MLRTVYIVGLFALFVSAYVTDELYLIPAPTSASLGKADHARLVKLTDTSISLASSCTGECSDIVLGGFKRIVIGSIDSQKGLAPWILSPHPEFATHPAPSSAASDTAPLTSVKVDFTRSGNELVPSLDTMDKSSEAYTLSIDNTNAAVVTAATAFAALRAFETLAQLIQYNTAGVPVVARVPLKLNDSPRFAWRGLLVDVSRHFLPIWKLRDVVDTLSAFKMNVMHLHLTDGQSFPLAIKSYPSLAQRGAYAPKAVYSQQDMKDLVAYARQRGILIVPEIDMPGHSLSWRYIDEDVVANCIDTYLHTDGFPENHMALNPASNLTWTAINNILTEVGDLFGSKFFHIGGDEVKKDCWAKSKQTNAISNFMKQHSLKDYAELERYFDHYIQNAALKKNRIPIVWDESLNLGNIVNSNVVVQIWHSKALFQKSVKAGYKTVASFAFYLDRQSPVCSGTCDNIYHMFSWTYRDMYKTDLTAGMGFTPAEEARILGGEAAIWAEFQDPASWDFMAISRLGAVAERFWSPASYTEPRSFERRSQQHRCLLVRRGFAPKSGPLSADFCETRDMF